MILLRGIAIWFIFIIVESLNGTIRNLWLVPSLGDLRAHQISFTTGSLLILLISTIFVRWLNASNFSQSISIGVFWMLLTVVFEVGLGRFVLGYSWSRIASDYDLSQGRLMSIGLVLLVLAPLIASQYGDIEYAQGGSGPPVLVIHGSGGGYDQGELMVRVLLGERFHWIAPSRFGYLRSTFHDGATFDDQAHVYAYLLDQLGVKKAAVVALSHGGPSALLFAVLHPERVSSLTLISAGVTSSTEQNQAQANHKCDALMMIFKHAPLYWGILHDD